MNKKLNITFFILLLFTISGYAQNSRNENKEYTINKSKEKLPSFPGGDNAFYNYLDKNVVVPEGFNKKEYMEKYHNQYVPISVGFTVDVDGNIINVKIIDGENELLDKKALEIVEKMPRWTPGYKDGSPIKVEYAIPVRFNLL